MSMHKQVHSEATYILRVNQFTTQQVGKGDKGRNKFSLNTKWVCTNMFIERQLTGWECTSSQEGRDRCVCVCLCGCGCAHVCGCVGVHACVCVGMCACVCMCLHYHRQQELTLTHHGSANPFGFAPLATLSWKELSFFTSFMASLKPSILAIFWGVSPSSLDSLVGQPSKKKRR